MFNNNSQDRLTTEDLKSLLSKKRNVRKQGRFHYTGEIGGATEEAKQHVSQALQTELGGGRNQVEVYDPERDEVFNVGVELMTDRSPNRLKVYSNRRL